MEDAFVWSTLERGGDVAATVAVAEPLTVIGVGEDAERVFVDLAPPIEIARVVGLFVGKCAGVDGLCMGPPELHVGFEGDGRAAIEVLKVSEAAELLIPTVFEGAEDGFEQHLLHGGVGVFLQHVEKKPTDFEGTAGADHSAFGELAEGVGVTEGGVFHEEFVFRMEMGHEAVEAVLNDLGVTGIGVNLIEFESQPAGDVEIGELGEAGTAADGGAAEEIGFANPLFHAPEQIDGFGEVGGILRNFRVFDEGEGDEEGGIGLALEEDGFAVFGESVPAAGFVVAGVFVNEPEDEFGRLFVFGARIKGVVEPGEHPGAAALHPDVFAGVVDRTGRIEAVEVTAVFAVERVPQPKRQHAPGKFFAVFIDEGLRHAA